MPTFQNDKTFTIGNKPIIPDIQNSNDRGWRVGRGGQRCLVKNVFNSENKHIVKIQDFNYSEELYIHTENIINEMPNFSITELGITYKTSKDLVEKLIDRFCEPRQLQNGKIRRPAWTYELEYNFKEVRNIDKNIHCSSESQIHRSTSNSYLSGTTLCRNEYILTLNRNFGRN